MRIFTSCTKKFGLIAACALMGMQANATIFTAVASGNFDNPLTWGGVAPSATLTSDVVVIPNGITVTLNQDANFLGSSTLAVNGNLVSAPSKSLILANTALTGSGNITVDSAVLGIASGLGFTGNLTAQNLTSAGTSITGASNITASNDLWLNNGTMAVAAGSVNVGNNATIHMAGGNMMATGSGAINLPASYNVVYNVGGNTGIEASGSGLHNVEVNIPASSTVTLSGDMSTNGTLALTSGMLALNGHNLAITGTGDVSASGSGSISSTNASNIAINSTGNFSGGLRFTPTANTVNNLTVNMGNSSSTAQLGSDLTVNGQLGLNMGKLNTGTHTLTIGTSGSVTGGSANSYVTTGTTGRLAMGLNAGASATYPIGTSHNYAPIMISAATGSASGTVGAGVMDSVYAHATTGTNLSIDQPVVNATWMVNNSASSNVDMSVQPMWSTNMELNGLNPAHVYVSSNTSGKWDMSTSGAATTSGNGMHTTTRDHINNSATTVAVVDQNANTTGINNIPVNNVFSVYPNPATASVTFNTSVEGVSVAIYDVMGHLVRSAVLDNTHTVPVNDLPAGLYHARLSANGFTAESRFVKQ